MKLLQLPEKIIVSILNFIYGFTKHMDYKLRKGLIFIVCLILFLLVGGIYTTRGMGIHKGQICLIGNVLLALMIVFSIDRKIEPANWRKLPIILMLLVALGMLVAATQHKLGDGYVLFIFDLMIGFPTLYIVWGNRGDYEELFKPVTWALSIIGIAFYAYSFILAANAEFVFRGDRAVSPFKNSNFVGILGMFVAISGLYLLVTYREKIWAIVISGAAIAAGSQFALISVSRASIIVILGCILITGIYVIKSRMQGIKYTSIKSIAIVLVSIAIFAFPGFYIDDIEVAQESKNATIATAEEQPTSTEETSKAAEPVKVSENKAEKGLATRFGTEGKDLDAISSGRLYKWKTYAKYFNLLGNTPGVVRKDLGRHAGAHNSYVEMAYVAGIPTGVLLLLFALTIGIIAIIQLFSKKYLEEKYLFSIMLAFTFAIESLLEIAMLPYTRLTPIVFYISIIPFMIKEKKN